MRITYFKADNGACGIYRLDNPLLEVKKSKKAQVFRVDKGDSLLRNLDCLEADIFVIPRLAGKDLLQHMKKFQNGGKKLVVDHDDFLFSIQPLMRSYGEFGTEEVRYKMPDGGIIDVWKDGVNFNIQENVERLDGVAKALEQADLVTVTTDILAEAYKKYNPNIVALPNCIDMDLWERLPLKRETDEFRLYWGGGDSHYGDWMLMPDILRAIMDKYKNTKLIIQGTLFTASTKNLPQDRIIHRKWVDTHAYPYTTAIIDPDLALIPLEDTKFNRCKSNIKWVEMAALGVPCVTSHVTPYKEYAAEDNGVYIENNNKDAWIDGISYMIDNADKRKEFADNAKKTVVKHFDIKTQYPKWIQAYEGIGG
ncbi:MAG: glycosyltransferase [Planctomycetota bacterium]|nr:glycosyltransferase [Planctomycetota bacterium]